VCWSIFKPGVHEESSVTVSVPFQFYQEAAPKISAQEGLFKVAARGADDVRAGSTQE